MEKHLSKKFGGELLQAPFKVKLGEDHQKALVKVKLEGDHR